MPKEYVPKDVKVLDFQDQNGNQAYNVQFSDGSYGFMLAKKAPQVGVPEYGDIEDTPKKSGDGTYKKFVRKQRDQQPQSAPKQDNADGMAWGNALHNAVLLMHYGLDPDDVLDNARLLYNGGRNREETPKTNPVPDTNVDQDEDIDLSEVPF